jgi:uncharacterized protein (TIGR02246 family)
MTLSRKLAAVFSASCIALTSVAFIAPASATAAPNQVRSAYNAWVDAIETANCQGSVVSSLYARNGALLATFNDVVAGRNNITKYFDGLTCNDELRVQTDSFRSGRQGNLAWATGLYTFSFNDESGERVEVPARYTFVFQKGRDGWRIVNHHSSIRPELA